MRQRMLAMVAGSALIVGLVAAPPATAAAEPLFLITPTSLDFGDQPLHSPSPQQTITVTNISGAPQMMNGSGGGAGLFGGAQNCQGLTIQPGDSCQMFYQFTPDKLGHATGLTHGAWNGQRFVIRFTGVGTPQFSITPDGLDFGHVPVGATSDPQDVLVTNLGTTATTPTLTGGAAGVFGGAQNCQGVSIPAGGSCHLEYGFAPNAIGTVNAIGRGTINHQKYSIALHGVGTGPAAYDFIALAPSRRYNSNAHTPVQARATRAVKVTGGDVPADAKAVDVTVTALHEAGTGALTIWPCGHKAPKTPTIQFRQAVPIGNHVNAAVGKKGKVCFRSSTRTDFTVDLDGYYPAASGFTPLSPRRKLGAPKSQTLAAGSTTRVKVLGGAVPSSVAAVALNITALHEAHDGRLTVWPCGRARPRSPSLSYQSAEPQSAFATTNVGKGGQVCIWTSQQTDAFVDVVGYHAPMTTIRPIAAHQVADRELKAGKTATVKVTGGATGIASDARAVIVEITASSETAGGTIALYPCGIPAPPTTVLSYQKSDAISNVGISYLGNGSVCMKTTRGIHLDVAVVGWYTDNDVT